MEFVKKFSLRFSRCPFVKNFPRQKFAPYGKPTLNYIGNSKIMKIDERTCRETCSDCVDKVERACIQKTRVGIAVRQYPTTF